MNKIFIKKNRKKIMLIILISLIIIILISSFFKANANNEYVDLGSTEVYQDIKPNKSIDTKLYSSKNMEWQEKGINNIRDYHQSIQIDEANINVENIDAKLISADDSTNGKHVVDYYSNFTDITGIKVVEMNEGGIISFTPNVSKEGLYQISFDYFDLEDSILPNEIGIMINGEIQYLESEIIEIYSDWSFVSKEFAIDRYYNEIQPNSHKKQIWKKFLVNDTTRMYRDFKFHLKPGDKISFTSSLGNYLIGNIYIDGINETLSYKDYLNKYPSTFTSDIKTIELNAEEMDERNNPSIGLKAERDPSASSYHSQFLRLNAIDGNSWREGGGEISWNFSVEKTGYYNISFKYLQSAIKNMPVFREIKIDGEIPYEELGCYAFPYNKNWVNRTLKDQDGNNLSVYLTEGEHSITLTTVIYPYRNTINMIRYIMGEINQLSLDVKKITGNSKDAYRDWDIELYVPHAKETLLEMAQLLEKVYNEATVLTKTQKPAELVNLLTARSMLLKLAKDVNKLPSKLVQLADGDYSTSQLIGDVAQRLSNSQLDLQKIMVHGDVKLKSPRANVFVRIIEGIKSLVLSFINNPYKASKTREGQLTVWVSHTRQYIEIMQRMVDAYYDGPLKVNLSQMPDENKLILANATGRAPDVAIGVNHWIPHDFALRKAVIDLRQFSGYEELVKKFSPGVMIPYAFEEGMYALPETQNFWVTYYRKDILNNIGINQVPQTWEEIIEILPQLQRYGMNYFSPVAAYEGFKPFVVTMPFIYQFGGNLFAEDGMSTMIDSKETLQGMELMSELFTLYNINKRVPNFYNHFRYGNLPIGTSDLATYLLLRSTASELQGQWEIDLHPGVKTIDENGQEKITRYAPAGGQSSMILATTKYKEEAWDFLSWWMSTDVQVEFAYNLQTIYGEMYLWNSANLEAFAKLPIPNKHKKVILEQWEYAIEATRLPGSYMIEREISNAWNKIVFNQVNARQALDDAVRAADREILYKMEEFGYAKNGKKLKDYKVPSIYNISEWLTEVKS